jgi:hypothetical protein
MELTITCNLTEMNASTYRRAIVSVIKNNVPYFKSIFRSLNPFQIHLGRRDSSFTYPHFLSSKPLQDLKSPAKNHSNFNTTTQNQRSQLLGSPMRQSRLLRLETPPVVKIPDNQSRDLPPCASPVLASTPSQNPATCIVAKSATSIHLPYSSVRCMDIAGPWQNVAGKTLNSSNQSSQLWKVRDGRERVGSWASLSG